MHLRPLLLGLGNGLRRVSIDTHLGCTIATTKNFARFQSCAYLMRLTTASFYSFDYLDRLPTPQRETC